MRSIRSLFALAVLALGLASIIESLVTLEWRYPYCDAPVDGPAAAVFGMPLPYVRFSGVSSLTYDVAPHWLAVDLVLLALVVALPLAIVAPRANRPRAPLVRRVAVALGATLLGVRVGWFVFLVTIGVLRPVDSLADAPYLEPSELRLARITTGWHQACAP